MSKFPCCFKENLELGKKNSVKKKRRKKNNTVMNVLMCFSSKLRIKQKYFGLYFFMMIKIEKKNNSFFKLKKK